MRASCREPLRTQALLGLFAGALLASHALAGEPNPRPLSAAKKKPGVAAQAKVSGGRADATAELSAAQLAIAQHVYVGQLPCELGKQVELRAHAQMPGHFDLHLHKQSFHMVPVETSTGAIRLEDPRAGAVWLQLANKSMLMNQKLGQRLADACMNPQQVEVARRMELQPGPSVLDQPVVGATN